MPDDYKVKTAQFEGPLGLLLELIEKRKLHINDVSLAAVADGFLDYMQKLSEFPTEAAANFISIASTLILIKSVSLLPSLSITEEEGQNIEELQERLRILKDIKEKGIHIKNMFGRNPIFAAEEQKNRRPVFAPTPELSIENFLAAIKSVIAAIPQKEVMRQAVIKKVMSLEEAIDNLVVRVGRELKMSFFKMNNKSDKVGVIVSFLAVLELFKRGTINLRQDSLFCDIDIETGESRVPVYS